MKALCLFLALAAGVPAAAQGVPPAPTAPTEPEPARLALARTAIDAVWPVGTYERMMRGTMTAMMDNMMESMFDMQIGDVVPGDVAKTDPKLARQTMREAMTKEDPHFLERMQIMNRVMFEEMIPIVNRFEPELREGLTRAYARKFTAPQLEDLNRFFATPTGRAYGPEAMMTFMDPEVMGQMTKFAPEMMKEMPRIMEKVKAATAHLPPPPEPRRQPSRR
jgi:hypothetical protein